MLAPPLVRSILHRVSNMWSSGMNSQEIAQSLGMTEPRALQYIQAAIAHRKGRSF